MKHNKNKFQVGWIFKFNKGKEMYNEMSERKMRMVESG